MKKIYCIICGKYKKIKNHKISHNFKRTLALPIISSKCGNEGENIFKEEQSIEILKVLGLIIDIEEYQKIYNYFKDKYNWRKHKSRI